jgi:hypothetical protein
MKLSMTAIIIATAIFVILPYLCFLLKGHNRRRKKELLIRNTLNDLDLSFDHKEQWNNNYIGIDVYRGILVFVRLIKKDSHLIKINLNNLKDIQIKRKVRSYKTEKKVDTELKSVDLELFMTTSEDPILLHFFSSKEKFMEDMEKKRAEKWESLIGQSMPKLPQQPIAA